MLVASSVQPTATALASLDLFAAIGCLLVAGIAWRRRTAPGATAFIVLTAAIAWWCLWPGLQLFSADWPSDYTRTRLGWIAIAIAPTAYLVFGLAYVNSTRTPVRTWLPWLAIVPALVLLAIATNDWLQLMWTIAPAATASGSVAVIVGRGPVWIFNLVYSYAVQAVITIVLAVFLITRRGPLYRRQTALLLVGLTIPWIANVLFVSGRTPFGAGDVTAPAFAISTIAFGIALFSQHLLEIMPLAQAEVFRSIDDGILVLDQNLHVLDVNPSAVRLARMPASKVNGRPLASVFPDLADRLLDPGRGSSLTVTHDGQERYLSIRRSRLVDRAGRVRGEVVLLTDVTEERRVGELEQSRDVIIQAQEQLRREIAEQLHGGVQTRLLLARYRLTAARQQLEEQSLAPADLLAIEEELDSIREHDVRSVSHRLHPSVILVGLVPAIEALVADQPAGLNVTVHADDRVRSLDTLVRNQLPSELRLHVYRMIEEALANVWKHAQATRADIALGCAANGNLLIDVVDDGRGPPPHLGALGLGLSTISARVGQLGGAWQLTAATGGGAHLAICLPERVLRDHAVIPAPCGLHD